MRVEGDRLVFTSVEEAKRIPREPGARGPASMEACGSCGGPVRRIVFTTAGGGDQLAIWRAYPLAVDGFVCTTCGEAVVPRSLSAQEITEIVQTGVLHARESRFDDAEYWFLRAVSSWPEFPPALANLAQVYVERADARGGDRDALRREAMRLLQRAADEPEHCPAAARLTLARVEAMLGNEKAALGRLEALAAAADVDEQVRNEAASMTAQIRGGKALFSRAVELVEGRLMMGGVRWSRLDENGRRPLLEAVALLKQATERDTSAFPSWWMLGKVHQRLGDYERAHEAFGRALEADPNHVDGCREYVSSSLDVGRAQSALPVAERACSLRPGDVGLRANLALAQLFAGKAEDASRTIEDALRTDPQDAITKALAALIAAVRDGRRALPRTLAELEGRL
jgi:tetratricopeptide (TPR) repeat protein